jgi:hypothetical protein
MSEDESKDLSYHSISDEVDSIDDEFEKLKQEVNSSVGLKSISNEPVKDKKTFDLKEREELIKEIEDANKLIKGLEISRKAELSRHNDKKTKLEDLITLKSSFFELEEKRRDKDLARLVYAGRIVFSGVATLVIIVAGLILHSQKDQLGSLLLGAGAAKAGLTIVEKKEKKDD